MFQIIKASGPAVLPNDQGREAVVDTIDVSNREEAWEYALLTAQEHAAQCSTVAVPLVHASSARRFVNLGYTFTTSNGTRVTYYAWEVV